MTTDRTPFDTRTIAVLWIALLSASSVLFSFAWTCATPFAALAAVAGTRLSRRDAIASVTLAWLGNQAIGYFVLHYPRTPNSFCWGLAIGVAAISATLLAGMVARTGRISVIATTLVAFTGAFGVYEGVLFATTAILHSGHGAFAAHIVFRIFEINAAALASLLVLALVVRTVGLPLPPRAAPLIAWS